MNDTIEAEEYLLLRHRRKTSLNTELDTDPDVDDLLSEQEGADEPIPYKRCRNFVSAIIEQAVADLKLPAFDHEKHRSGSIHLLREKQIYNSKVRLRRQAIEWFLSDSESPWSFWWCCDILGVDPNKLIKEFRSRDPEFNTMSKLKLFEYKCPLCGKVELLQDTRNYREKCPQCKRVMVPVLSTGGVVFKGSGFYETDYKRPSGK